MRHFGAIAMPLLGCSPAAGGDGWRMPVGEPRPSVAPVPEERGDLPEAVAPSQDDFWRSREDEAWAEAEATGRGVFVDFYADWCDECRGVAADSFRDPRVRRLIATRFVPLRLDVTEITRESREQLERFGVTRLPTSIAVARDGRELFRFRSPPEPEVIISRLESLGRAAER